MSAAAPELPATEERLIAESTLGAVRRLVLSRPERRNSLSRAMMAALDEALSRAADNPEVRVIVIAAEGPAFSAGHDLKELTAHRADVDGGRDFFAATMEQCARLMLAIVRHPKPVIAEVAGLATAAGCQLVASCDLAIASAEARFQTPGVHIGLFCSTPMVALSRSVSRKHALEMLLTGDTMPADRAAEIGLVNRVARPENLTTETMALAERIAEKSPLTLKIGKEAFQEQLDMPLADAYRYAAEVMVSNMLTDDAEEGIGAFLGKRTPDWTGK
jgi:enoyl-CoA hydratase/carnithine racemase